MLYSVDSNPQLRILKTTTLPLVQSDVVSVDVEALPHHHRSYLCLYGLSLGEGGGRVVRLSESEDVIQPKVHESVLVELLVKC